MYEIKYRDEQEFKDSGNDWVGAIPKDWDRTSLKRLVKTRITDGPHETPEFIDDGIPFMSAEAIVGSELSFDNKRGYISEKQHKVYRVKSKVEYHDILFCKSGSTTGKSALVKTHEEFGIWSPLAIIRANKKVDSKVLFFIIQSRIFRIQVENFWSFGTQPNIGMSTLENLVVPYSKNVEVQKRIANFLDIKTAQFDQIISKKEQLIEKLEEAKKSLISEVVTGKVKIVDGQLVEREASEMKDSGVEWIGDMPRTWNLVRIKMLSNISRGASPRPIEDPKFFDDENGEYGWTRIADVTKSDKFLVETKEKMSPLGANLSVKLEPGSLFLSIAGSVGKPCITAIKACVHDGFVYFPTLDKRLNDFLYIVFSGGQCYKGLGKLGTQLNLNRDTVGNICLPMDKTLATQVEISSFLNKKISEFDSIMENETKILNKLKQAKQSLISEAVTGKIDLRDWEIIEEGEMQ